MSSVGPVLSKVDEYHVNRSTIHQLTIFITGQARQLYEVRAIQAADQVTFKQFIESGKSAQVHFVRDSSKMRYNAA